MARHNGRFDVVSGSLLAEVLDGSIAAARGAVAQALAEASDSTRHRKVIRNDRQPFHDVPID